MDGSDQNRNEPTKQNAQIGSDSSKSQDGTARAKTTDSVPQMKGTQQTTQCHSKSEQSGNLCKSHPPNWCEKWTLILEFLGIIGLGIYCVYTIAEWKTFDSERKTMEQEFAASQANSVEQMKVFQGQLNEMQRARTLDERAWVAPFEMTTDTDPVITNASVFILMFKNTGKTPALNVSVGQNTTEDVNSIPANEPTIPSSLTLLPPDGVMPVHSGQFETRFVKGVKNGTQIPVYMYGRVTYEDIFGLKHWTEFCWSFEAGGHCGPAGVHNSCDDAQIHQMN